MSVAFDASLRDVPRLLQSILALVLGLPEKGFEGLA
jgi:hypothetical protein